MATWDDVRRTAMELPETLERSARAGFEWRVRDKLFAWERPLRRADLEALGDSAPEDPILAVHVPDVGAKEALLADDPEVYFTTPHFDGYSVILIRLESVPVVELEELLIESWLDQAPKRLVKDYLDTRY